jgi:hypothetical protein
MEEKEEVTAPELVITTEPSSPAGEEVTTAGPLGEEGQRDGEFVFTSLPPGSLATAEFTPKTSKRWW